MIEISYSQVSSYLTCPKKVQWAKSPNVPKGPMSAALVYGSIFHLALEKVATSTNLKSDVHELMMAYMRGIDPKTRPFIDDDEKPSSWDGSISYSKYDMRPDVFESWIVDAVNVVAQALSKEGGGVIPELALTRKFQVNDMEFVLRGVVDNILPNGTVIDYKLISPRWEPSSLQGACYALLMGGPVSFEFWTVVKEGIPQLKRVNVAEANNSAYLDFVVQNVLLPTAKSIEAGLFPANVASKLCSQQYCQYFSECVGKAIKGEL